MYSESNMILRSVTPRGFGAFEDKNSEETVSKTAAEEAAGEAVLLLELDFERDAGDEDADP